MELFDYRLVSLIHEAAHIMVKALAYHVALELPFLVGAYQSTFVRGRVLHDNFKLV